MQVDLFVFQTVVIKELCRELVGLRMSYPKIHVVFSSFRCQKAQHKLLYFYNMFSGRLLWTGHVIITEDTVIEVVSSWSLWFTEKNSPWVIICIIKGLQRQGEL